MAENLVFSSRARSSGLLDLSGVIVIVIDLVLSLRKLILLSLSVLAQTDSSVQPTYSVTNLVHVI